MRAEVISTGTELLLGEIVDTNTPFLASQLALLGIDLFFTSSVGDNYERMSGVLKQAWQRSDVILTTGGLGPTRGDITREAIAGLVGEKPAVDLSLKQTILDFFAQRGLEMPPNNIRQAMLIPSATAISNPQGTAPGWWVERDGKVIVAMPGPPHELQPMWYNHVLPRLQKRAGAVILSRTIKTLGLSEAAIDELVAHFISSTNPTLATYAKQDGIYLRITAKAASPEDARQMIAGREDSIRSLLGDYIWGADGETLESSTRQLLLARSLSLAVAESFTGGFLTYTIASAPQSSIYFHGGLVVNGDEARASLGLGPPAVTRPGADTAAALASLARSRLAAGAAIGIDGYTEKTGDSELSRVFIAVDGGSAGRSSTQSYSGRYALMRIRAAHQALFDLRKLLLKG